MLNRGRAKAKVIKWLNWVDVLGQECIDILFDGGKAIEVYRDQTGEHRVTHTMSEYNLMVKCAKEQDYTGPRPRYDRELYPKL